MADEDDTYRALIRPPRDEMNRMLLTEFYNLHYHTEYDEFMRAKIAYLKSHGWTMAELNKRIGESKNDARRRIHGIQPN